MPIKIPKDIPAFKILEKKNVFVMDEKKAEAQEIRPLRIGIVNLMPTKEDTETQLFRMIGDSPIQLEPVLIQMKTYESKNTSKSHMDKFYVYFDEAKKDGLDGLIITGAPVEHMEFEEVAYWQELTQIMDWAKENIASTMLICWAAQAGLYHFYHIPKYPVPEKIFGIFKHTHSDNCEYLLRGLDDEFYLPHSRHTEVKKEDILKNKDLEILIESKLTGVHSATNKDRSLVFVTGHSEYDRETLANEYFRDKNKGLDIAVPKNYFPEDDDTKNPTMNWRANAGVFYRNWVNFVYQTTNYDIKKYRMTN